MTSISNSKLWLDTVAELVVRDFLKPEGYDVVIPPIYYAEPCSAMPCNAGATTNYGDIGAPVRDITIASFNIIERARNPPDRDAATLAHELVHVAVSPRYVDRDDHEMPEFVRLVRKMGLLGDPHGTYEGPEFINWLNSTVVPEYLEREKQHGRSADTAVPSGIVQSLLAKAAEMEADSRPAT